MPAGAVNASLGASGAAGCAAAAGGCCPAGGCAGGVVWAKAAAGARASASTNVEVTKNRIPISSLGKAQGNHTVSHENGHHFVGHEHAVPGQPQATTLSDEPSRLEKRPQRVAVLLKDVHAVSPAGRVRVDPRGEPQAGEQRLFQTLVTRQYAALADGAGAVRHAADIFVSAGDVFPSDAVERAVRAAPEREPLAVGPVFQVVPRLASRPRDVRDLVLPQPRVLEPLHRAQV